MNEANGLNEVMFTSAAVFDLLLHIDELRDYNIGMTETLNGNLQLQVGDSTYLIDTQAATTIRVEDEIVGELEVQTEEAYDEIIDKVAEEYDAEEYFNMNDADSVYLGDEDSTIPISYTDESEYIDPDYSEPEDVVEAGILKEIAKSLTLGGMIRFATKHLLK